MVRSRHEGLVLTARSSQFEADVLERIATLRSLGVHVGVIGTVSEEIVDALSADQRAVAVLVFTDEQGAEVVIVDESGSVERRDRGSTAAQALVRAGRAIVDRLRIMDIEARADQVGSGAVAIEVSRATEEQSEESMSASAPSEHSLIELAREVAFDADVQDAHISVDAEGRLLLALEDPDDALLAILDAFWQRGVHAGVLVLDPMPTVEALDDLVRGRIDPGLPRDAYDDCWGITLEAISEREGVATALFALSDGAVGSSGARLGDGSGGGRWVLAAGIYTGTGPDTHLLTGPVVWHLPTAIPEDATVHRALDLRAGVLHEELISAAGGYRSVRFSSLARPGTTVFRAQLFARPADGPLLLRPPEDVDIEVGPSGATQWMRVVGDQGGIAAAVRQFESESEGHPVLDRIAAYHATTEQPPDPTVAVDRVERATRIGFDALLNEHRRAWS
jgi:hypothetical protein